jgi:hypothetical protein
MKLPLHIILAFGWPDIDTMGKGEFVLIVVFLIVGIVILNKLLKNDRGFCGLCAPA